MQRRLITINIHMVCYFCF